MPGPSTSSRLRRLRDARLLRQHDRGAATYYTPAERFLSAEFNAAEQSGDLGGKSGDLGEQSGDLGEQSGDLGEQSGDLGEKSGDLGEKSGDLGEKSGDLDTIAWDGLSAELAVAVAELNRWTPQPELRRLIQRLCAWKPMSAAELAVLLKRAQSYLRTSYLGPMIQSGELVYTIPDKPNDPGQRYRAGRAP